MAKVANNKHYFRFKTRNHRTGEDRTIVAKAKVKFAPAPVLLTLDAEDVRRSIKLKGVGNTQTCTMAVCAARQADKFPHGVEGYIDWQYSRAYVVSKVGKDGLPSECYVYSHEDDIAKVNDTKGGQKKLLAQLEAQGSRIIRLNPVTERKNPKDGRPVGARDGTRTSKPVPRGAALRFAVVQSGLT